MMADVNLSTRLSGLADRIAQTPVQIEDANTAREAAARLDMAEQEIDAQTQTIVELMKRAERAEASLSEALAALGEIYALWRCECREVQS
jgi:putative heme degradation protein